MNFTAFASTLTELLRVDVSGLVLTPQLGLYDELALDSLQAFELVVIVESLADALVPPPVLPELLTLGDAFRYYEDLRAPSIP